MKRIFLWLPHLEGHRQIYCREFCDYALARGFSVTVAADLAGLGEYAPLESLARDPRVTFVPDSWSWRPTPLERLRGLTAASREAYADVTFLAEADACRGVLTAQLTHPSLRLPGRRVALFIRSTKYVHERVQPWRLRLFHEIVAQHLPVLEKALVLDEVFAAKNKGRYVWLPDVGVWTGEKTSSEGDDEAEAWRIRIADFLATQRGKAVVVYLGMPQERRNYERLLQLACDIDGCFIHCGATHDPSGYPHGVPAPRQELISRSAILEYGRFYQSFDTARVTMAAARCVVLPYGPEHLTSSGAMLQALMAGRPVLVPDRGLMGQRVRGSGLGLTFVPDDWDDMRGKFAALQGTRAGSFDEPIERFLGYFHSAQFEAAMDVAFGLSSTGPRIPAGSPAVQ